MRFLNPGDVRQIRVDPSITGVSVPFQVYGPCSVHIAPNMGNVRVQVSNDRMYLHRHTYGIGNSPDAMHQPDPVFNTSFSSTWCAAGITATSSSANQFLNIPVQRRYMRITSSALTSTTRNVVAGFVFSRPRI